MVRICDSYQLTSNDNLPTVHTLFIGLVCTAEEVAWASEEEAWASPVFSTCARCISHYLLLVKLHLMYYGCELTWLQDVRLHFRDDSSSCNLASNTLIGDSRMFECDLIFIPITLALLACPLVRAWHVHGINKDKSENDKRKVCKEDNRNRSKDSICIGGTVNGMYSFYTKKQVLIKVSFPASHLTITPPLTPSSIPQCSHLMNTPQIHCHSCDKVFSPHELSQHLTKNALCRTTQMALQTPLVFQSMLAKGNISNLTLQDNWDMGTANKSNGEWS
jgi:hypothetical protein